MGGSRVGGGVIGEKYRVIRDFTGRIFLTRLMIKLDLASLLQISVQCVSKDKYSSTVDEFQEMDTFFTFLGMIIINTP